jgi:hypothetical protein
VGEARTPLNLGVMHRRGFGFRMTSSKPIGGSILQQLAVATGQKKCGRPCGMHL